VGPKITGPRALRGKTRPGVQGGQGGQGQSAVNSRIPLTVRLKILRPPTQLSGGLAAASRYRQIENIRGQGRIPGCWTAALWIRVSSRRPPKVPPRTGPGL